MHFHRLSRLLLTALQLSPALAPALRAHDGVTMLDPMLVEGRSLDLTGVATAASDGKVGSAELAARPWLRRGELLEVVPGVVVTQHSGAGKANQYFLRGFNLDHGTDFAVTVGGMPVNQRTHGHGQGYADLNFVIPEFVQSVTYQKGPHHAANGDFASAGAARFALVEALPRDFVRLEAGEDDFIRFVGGATIMDATSPGSATTVGAEAAYQNGPWDNPEHSRRYNALARHSWGGADTRHSLTALAYQAEWDSTDQIPERAVTSGAIGRFGAIDPTDGGESDRASLSYDYAVSGADSDATVNLYAYRQRMDLYSNFTYFQADPANGDQFNQRDERTVLGGELVRRWEREAAGRPLALTAGVQTRADFIDVGLHNTAARSRLSTVREDDITELSAAVFAEADYRLADWARVRPGLRADLYSFDVESDLAANSGDATDSILGPKLGVILGPWAKNEIYLNAGEGFHSNDARGVTITVDPADGVTPADAADPLVRSRGAEIGVRNSAVPGLVSTLSVWWLELDSELIYVGDAGATEAGDATRRVGVEWNNYYKPADWLALDADLAFTRARYDAPTGDPANLGRHIPGSVATVATAGATAQLGGGWSASLRSRYYGPQPLIEDDSVQGKSSLTFNARLAWRNRDWEAALSVLNLLDRANNDIVYYYESQLPGEAAPVADRHFHPAEPRTVRFTVTRWF